MPIRIEVDRHTGIVWSVCEGEITTEMYLAHPSQLAAIHGPPVPWREVFDVRAVTKASVSPDDIRRIADQAPATLPPLRGGRIATLVGSDLSYGLGRMFQAHVASLGVQVLVTRDESEAIRFLGS